MENTRNDHQETVNKVYNYAANKMINQEKKVMK